MVAMFGTPLLVKLWGKVSPPDQFSEFDRYAPEQLKRRNNWIDRIGVFLALSGMCLPIYLYDSGVSKHNPWPVGLGFGLMVILPFLFVAAVTLPKGQERFREYWRFYEVKYGTATRRR